METTIFAVFVLFWEEFYGIKLSLRVRFWTEKIQRVAFWKKKNKTSGFNFKISQRVRCCIEKKSNASDYDIDTFRHLASHRQLHWKIPFSSVNP